MEPTARRAIADGERDAAAGIWGAAAPTVAITEALLAADEYKNTTTPIKRRNELVKAVHGHGQALCKFRDPASGRLHEVH